MAATTRPAAAYVMPRCEFVSDSGRQCRTRTDRRVNGKVACYDHATALSAR